MLYNQFARQYVEQCEPRKDAGCGDLDDGMGQSNDEAVGEIVGHGGVLGLRICFFLHSIWAWEWADFFLRSKSIYEERMYGL